MTAAAPMRRVIITEQTTSVYEVPSLWLDEHKVDEEGIPVDPETLAESLEGDAVAVDLLDNHTPVEQKILDRTITISEVPAV